MRLCTMEDDDDDEEVAAASSTSTSAVVDAEGLGEAPAAVEDDRAAGMVGEAGQTGAEDGAANILCGSSSSDADSGGNPS